jgi:tetratricopeptide (TPR) repeat protein
VILYGRAAERAAIEDFLAEVTAGAGRALVLRGEAGMGKSALLDLAAESAGPMRVLRATGAEPEMGLAFAALHQLLRPVTELLDVLPGPQRDAVRGALGLASSSTDDRFLVSAGVLSLLTEAAAGPGLLCLIDDFQWIDRASADALLFCARRLATEGVGLLIAVRENAGPGAVLRGVADLRVAGIDARSAADLIASRVPGVPAHWVSEQLVALTGGNPLALRETAELLNPEQVTGRAPLPDPLPMGTDAGELFGDQVERLSEELEFAATGERLNGRISTSAAVSEEGLALAREAGYVNSAAAHLANLAMVAAIRGEEVACRTYADEALAIAIPHRIGLRVGVASYALGLLDLGMGRFTTAHSRLSALTTAGPGAGHPTVVWRSAPDLAEAAIACGDLEAARGAVAYLERWSANAGTARSRALLLHCRAMLDDGDKAFALFEEASRLHAADGGGSFEQARTFLSYGERLRRAHRPGDARQPLRSALESFQRLGAEPWARRARDELRRRRDGVPSRAERAQRTHAAGAADRPSGRRRRLQPGGGDPPVPQPAHRGVPPVQGLSQARRHLAHRARPTDRHHSGTLRRYGTTRPPAPVTGPSGPTDGTGVTTGQAAHIRTEQPLDEGSTYAGWTHGADRGHRAVDRGVRRSGGPAPAAGDGLDVPGRAVAR